MSTGALAAGDDVSPKPATFAGRLNISTFAFQDDNSKSPRRSPRLMGVQVAGTSPSPSPSRGSKINNNGTETLSSRSLSLVKMESSSSATPMLSDESSSPTKKRTRPSSSSQSTTISPNKRKKTKPSTGYAPPQTYAHLPHLPDAIAPKLLILFIGLNPGIQTAQTGHAYAHPSNLFWKLLYSSGITSRLCHASEDKKMPVLYSLGLTNIVSRPSRCGSELSRQEMDDGVAVLKEKVRRYRPESVCVVGKSIWESFWRVRKGRKLGKEEFRYGWQDESERFGGIKRGEVVEGEVVVEGWEGARVFVATSTSGLAAGMRPAEKEAVWRELGDWVVQRRKEREDEKEDGDVEIKEE